MSDILNKIVATKHEEIAAARAHRGLASLRDEAEARTDVRGFEAALRATVRESSNRDTSRLVGGALSAPVRKTS